MRLTVYTVLIITVRRIQRLALTSGHVMRLPARHLRSISLMAQLVRRVASSRVAWVRIPNLFLDNACC